MKCIGRYWVLHAIVVYDCEDEDGNEEYDFDGNEEYDFDDKDTDTYETNCTHISAALTMNGESGFTYLYVY